MTQIGAYGSIKVCMLRVVLLNDDCTFHTGPGSAVVTRAIVSLNSTPEYDTGQEYLQKTGCGDLAISVKDIDRLKRVNLEMVLCLRDLELLSILTGGTTYLGAADNPTTSGKVVGMSRRDVGATANAATSVELWTRAADASGDCGGTSAISWWRWVWGKTLFTLGNVELGDNVHMINLSGFAQPNPQWGTGPYDDFPSSTELSDGAAETFILDPDGPPSVLLDGTTELVGFDSITQPS